MACNGQCGRTCAECFRTMNNNPAIIDPDGAALAFEAVLPLLHAQTETRRSNTSFDKAILHAASTGRMIKQPEVRAKFAGMPAGDFDQQHVDLLETVALATWHVTVSLESASVQRSGRQDLRGRHHRRDEAQEAHDQGGRVPPGTRGRGLDRADRDPRGHGLPRSGQRSRPAGRAVSAPRRRPRRRHPALPGRGSRPRRAARTRDPPGAGRRPGDGRRLLE